MPRAIKNAADGSKSKRLGLGLHVDLDHDVAKTDEEREVVEVGAEATEKTSRVLDEEAQAAGRERPCSRDLTAMLITIFVV